MANPPDDDAKRKLHPRRKTARRLGISESSFDILVRNGVIRTVHRGRYIFVTEAELQRWEGKSLPTMWPPKHEGKTTRHYYGPDG
jgi:hypothetical protein